MDWLETVYHHFVHLVEFILAGLSIASVICSTIANFLPNPITPHKNPDGTEGTYIHSSYPYWFFYMFINALALNISKVFGGAHPRGEENKFNNIITLFIMLLSKGVMGEKSKEALSVVEEGEKLAPQVEEDIKDIEEIIKTGEEIEETIHHHPPSTPPSV